jgi:hypothetical protein
MMADITAEIKRCFEEEYDGGYTYSEVENVIAWAVEFGRNYERNLFKQFIEEQNNDKENR